MSTVPHARPSPLGAAALGVRRHLQHIRYRLTMNGRTPKQDKQCLAELEAGINTLLNAVRTQRQLDRQRLLHQIALQTKEKKPHANPHR